MKEILDQQQFIDLFRKHYKFLCMISLHHVHDVAAAEDVVQEFFIDYWEKRKEIPLKGSFEAYAARAVKYKSISAMRSLTTDDKRLNKFGNETYSELDDDDSGSYRYSLQLQVLSLIDQLPPERRKVLLLSAKEGLSNQEIADHLGISIHTVKSQISKAYAFIRSNAKLSDGNPDSGKGGNDVLSNTAILIALLAING
jgi:RNA polymerase sigma-70 factor (ECF subfamily)